MRPKAHAQSEHSGALQDGTIDDRILLTRLMPSSVEQGPSSDAPLSGGGDHGAFRVDTSVEGQWTPRHPSGKVPQVVQIVDGVRRVEAYAVSDTVSGAIAPALFGSYAAGVVRCESGRASIPEDRRLLHVEHCYLQVGPTAEDLVVVAGGNELRYRAVPVPNALKPSDLVRELTNPGSTDRSMTGRDAGPPESLAGVPAFAGRCRSEQARLGGAEGAVARVREACAGMLARASGPGRRCERASGRERYRP